MMNDLEVEKLYRLGRTLGNGTFAVVRQAKCLRDSTKWAIKIIKRHALSLDDEESLKMEIAILRQVVHPNIISIKEVFYCVDNVFLVTELMTGGELFDRIVTKDHYSEREAKLALSDIVIAVHYCHTNNIVHRDLKPENILYSTAEEGSVLKLADFGLAAVLRPDESMHQSCGTPGYVAPEILKNEPYGREVDIWAVGVILYILLCGFPPFYDDNNKRLFALIVHARYSFPAPYWTDVSSPAKDLVCRLLRVRPEDRLTTAQILTHPWMTTDAPAYHLSHLQANLRSYNSKRRLRAAIRAVQVSNHMVKVAAIGSPSKDSSSGTMEGYSTIP